MDMWDQWRRNRNTIGGAGVRGCEAADYPHEASAYEGQKLGGANPCVRLQQLQFNSQPKVDRYVPYSYLDTWL